VIGVLTGRFRQVGASLAALLGMLPRTPSYFARRRTQVKLREVPDSEVAGLQVRGSARLASYMRSRDSRQVDPDSTTERRWRQTAGSAPALAWLAVSLLALLGSRQLITNGVPRFGEFLAFPVSPRAILSDYMSGWSGHGLGSTTAGPTGIGLLAIGSVGTLFHMALLHTVLVVGLLFAGYLGMWRLASLFPTARARITALVVYAAVPLPSQLLANGRWAALVCYAAAPWAVHHLRRIAGIDTSGSRHDEAVERSVVVAGRKQLRWAAQLTLLTAVAVAFAPSFGLLLVVIGLLLAVATVLCGGSPLAAAKLAGVALGAVVVALFANLPWALSLAGSDGWTSIVGVPVSSARSLGVAELARFLADDGGLGLVAMLLFLPVLVAPLWHVRGGSPGRFAPRRLCLASVALRFLTIERRCRFECPSLACCWCRWQSVSPWPQPAWLPPFKTMFSVARSAGVSRLGCWRPLVSLSALCRVRSLSPMAGGARQTARLCRC
ncbi:MAG: hypothetical protein LH616_16055, partial [Ilumatobacteraceae bacterium]|nr:hypothetical protein [Ilumatobacteraceae bacterium]